MSTSDGRISSDFLERRGVELVTKKIRGGIVADPKNSTAYVRSVEAANVILANQQLSSATVNHNDFFYAKAYFKRNGVSESNSSVMALITIDVARIQKKSIQMLIHELEQNGVMFDFQTYLYMNLVRPLSAQMSILVPQTTEDSYRSRYIIP